MTLLETAWNESTYEDRKSFVERICSSHFSIVREELKKSVERKHKPREDERETINEEVG